MSGDICPYVRTKIIRLKSREIMPNRQAPPIIRAEKQWCGYPGMEYTERTLGGLLCAGDVAKCSIPGLWPEK